MALTCGDGESPSEMMRLIAVACNCALFRAVVTGGLPQPCPSEISERTARIRCEQTCGRHGTPGLEPVEQHQAERCRAAGIRTD
jgi:hypothetical protein